MADRAGNRVVTATLSASTVDLVYLSAAGQGIKVINQSGSAPIYFTVSRPGGACPVPTVGGAETYCAASVTGAFDFVRHDGMYGSIVQLISSGTPTYTVEVSSRNLPG